MSHLRGETGGTAFRATVVVAALVGVAAACFAVAVLVRGHDTDTTNPLTERGFTDFRDRLEEVSGSTMVFRGFAGADDGLISTPIDASSNRSETFTWRDGDFLEASTAGTETTYTSRFDLATIDPAGIPANVELALSLANDPDRVSIIVGQANHPGACYEVVASNRDDEYASVLAACSGRMLENTVR